MTTIAVISEDLVSDQWNPHTNLLFQSTVLFSSLPDIIVITLMDNSQRKFRKSLQLTKLNFLYRISDNLENSILFIDDIAMLN